MSEEVKKEKVTVEDVGRWAKWYSTNKHWINPLVAAIAVYFGANPANIEKWIPDLSGVVGGNNTELVKRVDKLETNVETLTKAVDAHERKLFPLEVPVGESSAVGGEKPVYRE